MISSWKIYQTHTTQGDKLISRGWCKSWDTPGWGSDTTYSNEISLAKLFCFFHRNIWQQDVFPYKNKKIIKKRYLGGWLQHLVNQLSWWLLRSSALLGEGRGVPDGSRELVPFLPAWSCALGLCLAPFPWVMCPSLPLPMGWQADGDFRLTAKWHRPAIRCHARCQHSVNCNN